MLQSICKEGRVHTAPGLAKFLLCMLFQQHTQRPFKAGQLSTLAVQDGISQPWIQQELQDKTHQFTETSPSGKGISHLPVQQWDSQNLPTRWYIRASFTCRSRQVSTGDVGGRAVSSCLLLCTHTGPAQIPNPPHASCCWPITNTERVWAQAHFFPILYFPPDVYKICLQV